MNVRSQLNIILNLTLTIKDYKIWNENSKIIINLFPQRKDIRVYIIKLGFLDTALYLNQCRSLRNEKCEFLRKKI